MEKNIKNDRIKKKKNELPIMTDLEVSTHAAKFVGKRREIQIMIYLVK